MVEQYRVTKYDPGQRSVSGAYPVDDWTSYSNVGKPFGGDLLTQERYRSVERAYLEAAVSFLEEAHIRELKVVCLENHWRSTSAPTEGGFISLQELPAVLQSLLRQEYWCKLENSSAFIHVGYDYYMYIGVPCRCFAAEALALKLGLFPEAFESPYFNNAA